MSLKTKERFMLAAAALAKKGRGRTAPNPCVGAVLVRKGEIAAEGWHQKYGGPHAEIEALSDARRKGVDPALCSLFVTLEPCNHTGKTPPCTQAVLEAGIKHVVVGTRDPNPNVQGGGVEFLRGNGVQVETGVAEQACLDLIADFMVWNLTPATYNILKLASTLDGRIATRTGDSKWVSGEESRQGVHGLRARVGAVVVGGNTFYADNPRLTCRKGQNAKGAAQPLAVVVTSRLPTPDDDFFLLQERARETVFWTSKQASESERADSLRTVGCRVWGLGVWDSPEGDVRGGFDFAPGFSRLREECGIWSTLCEGGGGLALSFLAQGLMHEFRLFLAPKVLGDEKAKPLFSGRKTPRMDEAYGFRLAETRASGEDVLLILRPKK